MLLSELVKGENVSVFGKDVEICVCYSYSKKVVENGLFFCLDGKVRGSDFIEEAEKFGAVAVVSERRTETGLTQVVVSDARKYYALLTAKFYGDPQDRMKIIGVVGTNGKTSTAKMIEEVFTADGKTIGNIGTNGAYLGGKKLYSALTTPDPEDLYSVLKIMVDEGAEYVVMEVSAHAIRLKKVSPIKFDTLIFTNCTEDHLDYFGDMESYAAVKKSIFDENRQSFMIVNGDDGLGREIADASISETVTYGVFDPSDVFATMIRERKTGTDFVVNLSDDIYEVKSRLLGRFNVYNSLAAMTCAAHYGIDPLVAVSVFKNMPAVSGRMEKVAETGGADVFVDYAHTPDGLEKSLLYLRKVTKGDLVVVFGCGGNRERQKRPLMGKTAGDIADFVIITSDNPRYEEPSRIISEIEVGVKEATSDYLAVRDRRAAIRCGLNMLKKGDTLLIAGKGAEDSQEIMGVKRDFSDKEVVREILSEND